MSSNSHLLNMYQVLTVREGTNFGPGEGYILLSVSFHTIMCKSGQNRYQVSHIFLCQKIFGGNSQKRWHMSWSSEMSWRDPHMLRGWYEERLEAKAFGRPRQWRFP